MSRQARLPLVRAGTSGFSYAPWKGSFYPADIPNTGMLSYYATRLPTVEINNTFYRMPRRQVVAAWAAQVDSEFRFAIKAPRRITHNKRLLDVAEETSNLFAALTPFEESLGAVLFQLPPNFKKDEERLDTLLTAAASQVPTVLEFRHDSWLCSEVYALLSRHGAALCITDAAESPAPELTATAGFGYLRLRRGNYTADDLDKWARLIAKQPWQEVFVYFKHEDAGSTQLAQALLDRTAPP